MEFVFPKSLKERDAERGAAGRLQPPVYGERGRVEKKISVFSPGGKEKEKKRKKKKEEVRKLFTFDKSF